MERRQKKILLLILLVVFFALVTYQLKKFGGRSEETAGIPISSEAPLGREARLSSLQAESLLPEINLKLLQQPMPAYSVLGRNLFRFGAAKATPSPSSPRTRTSSRAQQTTTPRRTEEGVVTDQTTAEQQASSPALEELAGFKFLGFARKDSHMIATLKKGDKILVGIKGDIIEERFTILEIDYQYIELGVVNTSLKQKIPLVSDSF